VIEEGGQQGPVDLALEPLGVAADQPTQRERRGGPLQQDRLAGGRRLAGPDQQATPVLAPGSDGGHQPARRGVESGPGGGRRVDLARVRLPALEQQLGRLAGGVVGEHLAGQVFQDDRRAGQRGRLRDDLGRLGSLDGQLGEPLVDLLGRAQLGELGVDDHGVDGLGDPHELGRAVQLDQRQAEPLGGLHHDRRYPGDVGPAQLDHQPAGAHLGQLRDEATQALVVAGQADPGRQDQLAAAQQRSDVGHLGDVHPAHRPVEAAFTGDDPGGAVANRVEGQHIPNRRKHRGTR
jgi:hypothetical protein